MYLAICSPIIVSPTLTQRSAKYLYSMEKNNSMIATQRKEREGVREGGREGGKGGGKWEGGREGGKEGKEGGGAYK